ncbi:MAG: type II secretion system protein GspL [Croceibacterium sp.]
MEKPPNLLPTSDDPPELVGDGPERLISGIWSLDAGHLANVENFDEGPAVVLVRTEHVLILAVQLPPMASASRRRAALPFAIEDRIAEPLEEVHVALGAEIATNTFLVGVVRHDLMREWVVRLAEAGLEQGALVPDALALPVPGPDTWAVDLASDRVMVRLPDATGFAMRLATFAPAWGAAGEPACLAYGDPLPPQMAGAATGLEPQPLAQRLLVPALDLRQGLYARPRKAIDPLWRRIALVAAAGALAHATIAAADTLALSHLAAERDAKVRALVATVQPSLVIGADLGTALADLTPDPAITGPSRFLTLVSRAGAALGAGGTPVTWRSINFDQHAGTLTIAVETDDLAGLQRVQQALAKAGLSAQAGAASTEQGRAVGTFTVPTT